MTLPLAFRLCPSRQHHTTGGADTPVPAWSSALSIHRRPTFQSPCWNQNPRSAASRSAAAGLARDGHRSGDAIPALRGLARRGGGRHPGRTDAGQITVFKSLGLAVEDVAAAKLAYERARDRKIGERFGLD
jgi:hypothetical protein